MTNESLKAKLRQKYLLLREFYDDKEVSSQKISEYLSLLLENYHNIAAYYPIKGEVDIWPLVVELATSKNIYLPSSKDRLEFNKLDSIDNLALGKMDILEAQGPKIDNINYLEAIIIPSIAISPFGARLGFGKGLYDTALANYNGLKIGVIYSFQETDVEFKEIHDLQFDIIVSEKGFKKIGEKNV